MRRDERSGPTWTCDLCHNRSNPTKTIVCTICAATRPVHRFGLKVDRKYYACILKSKGFAPSVSVCEVSTQLCVQFKVPIDTDSSDSVEESISAAIVEHGRNQAADTVEAAKAAKAALVRPDALTIPEDESIDGNTTLMSPSVMGDSPSPKKGSKKHRQKAKSNASTPTQMSGSFLGMFDPGMSLFDTVMHNANGFAYDAKIGQYISVDTMNHPAHETLPHHEHSVKKNLDYVEQMRRERTVMDQVVKDVVKRRADDVLYDVHADLDVNPTEWDKRIECALCERTYPKSQMPGQISFKTIADWRASRDAPFPEGDNRLTHGRLHNATRLCSFCTQFFDSRAGNLVDKQAIKESVGVGHIGLDGPLNCSNTVYKKLFRKGVEKQKDFEENALVKMQHRVALDVLRFKAQNKNKDARFLFNPKVANSIVDQEKVGSFLRNKYVKHGGVQAAALLVESKPSKSNKVILKPVVSVTDSVDSHGSIVRSRAPSEISAIERSASHSTTETFRSSSAGLTSTASTVKTMVTIKAPRQKLSIAQKNINAKSVVALDIIDHVLQPQVDTSASTSISPKKRRKPRDSQDSFEEGLSSTGEALKPRRLKAIKDQAAPAKERKPLILKVNSSALLEGTNGKGEVMEIDLGAVSKGIDGFTEGMSRSLSVGPASTKSEFSLPLRGLLQNMQLRRRDTDSSAMGNAKQILTVSEEPSPPREPEVKGLSKTVPANNKVKKSVRIEENSTVQEKKPQHVELPALHKKPFELNTTSPERSKHAPNKPATNSPKHARDLGKKLKPLKHAYSKPAPAKKEKEKAAPGQGAAWKHNIKKPVLRDVFDTNSPSAKRAVQDSSYITHVPHDDEFLVDEEYSDDPAEFSGSEAGSIHSAISSKKYPVTPPLRKSRSDSFASDYSYNDPFENDDVEEELGADPSAKEWSQVGSMDSYNWVSAGPYVETSGEGATGQAGYAAADNGFSPVNLEPSMLGGGIERMRMLSRGSANGIMSPASRGASASIYSGRHTPKTPKIGMVSLNHPGPAAVGSTIEEDRYNQRVKSRGSRGSGILSPASGASAGVRYADRIKTPRPIMEEKPKAAAPVLVPVVAPVPLARARAKSEVLLKMFSESGEEMSTEVASEKPRRRSRF